MKKKFCMKRKSYFLIFLLWLGGTIAMLFPLSFCLADEATTTIEAISLPAPTNLTATVISHNRIDLSWSAVSGAASYKVYRGGILIASPATNSYSDTGLSPKTTHSYTVSAVNIYGGESAQSSSISATTLAVGAVFIPPTPPEVILEPSPEHPEVPKSLIINDGDVYTNSVKVNLFLSVENAFQMAISNTTDFAGISWEPYQTTKKWTLTKGDGKKTVYTKFRSSAGGVSKVVSDSIILDTTSPTNVANFEAIPGDSQITLTWQNPPESDFEAVKILRSTKFYPASPEEGILIYDGKGISFIDTGLINGIRYYYTAFTYDKIGNYASGAIISAIPQKPLPPEEIPQEEVPPEEILPEEKPPITPPPLEIEELMLEDFGFIQKGKKISLEEGIKIKAETEKPLTIYILYEKVPEVLKTILVTLEKEGKLFSFLLKVNPEKTAYLATLMPPEEPGTYLLTLTALDYKNQTIKKISGKLIVEKPEIITPKVSLSWYQKIILWYGKINSAFLSQWAFLSNWLQLSWQKLWPF